MSPPPSLRAFTWKERITRALEPELGRITLEVPSRDEVVTRAELLARIETLSRELECSQQPLLLWLGKSRQFYEFVLASLSAEHDFCPLDSSVPEARVRSVAQGLGRPLLVTDNEHQLHDCVSSVSPTQTDGITMASNATGRSPSEGPQSKSEGSYYISTSGSTGAPRLVAGRQQALHAFVDWSVPFYEISPETRWSQFSSTGFDLTIVDLLTVILGGGTLVALSGLHERLRPGAFVSVHNLTHWHSVPSMIPHLLQAGSHNLDSLTCLSFCGEPLLRSHCTELRGTLPHSRIVNTYGPTEATLFCSAHELTEEDLDYSFVPSVPIGEPIPGWSFTFHPEGNEGESRLVIAGHHLAAGYLNESVPSFGLNDAGLSTFDTGDYFRHSRGHTYFSRRKDTQVKVNGNRIDLTEIANACGQVGLPRAIALLHEGRLTLILESEVSLSSRDITSRLEAVLPSYALPSRVLFTARLPRTPSGKIDSKGLRAWMSTP
ncbi:MAG: AMP-binding protein [Solirubrobacterales bacterium]